MKKVLFLTLFLMIFGAASVKAQVRIGGNGAPHGAAILDLNADDANNGTKTLALPRVSLTSTADKMGNVELLSGMLVYNTSAGGLSEGVYYWDGSQWVKPNSTAYSESASIKLNGTSFERAALTGDVTAAANSNATIIADNAVTSAKILDGTIATSDLNNAAVTTDKIAPNAVTSDLIAGLAVTDTKIASGAITASKLASMGAAEGNFLRYDGAAWAPADVPGSLGTAGGGRIVLMTRAAGTPWPSFDGWAYLPLGCKQGNLAKNGFYNPVGYLIPGTGEVSSAAGGHVCAANSACACLFQTF